jgi:hypothetical protein
MIRPGRLAIGVRHFLKILIGESCEAAGRAASRFLFFGYQSSMRVEVVSDEHELRLE